MDLTNQIWKDVVGYEGIYQVSNIGQVRSVTRWVEKKNGNKVKLIGKLLRPAFLKTGYSYVHIRKEGVSKNRVIHRLVAMAFLPNPKRFICVNHINSIRNDNRVENLEWATYSQNILHAYKYGNMEAMQGEKHGRAKLKSEDVLKISKMAHQGLCHKDIANEFKITTGMVSMIKRGKTWRHLIA